MFIPKKVNFTLQIKTQKSKTRITLQQVMKGPFQKKISIQPSGYLGRYLGYTADFLATGIFLRFDDNSKYPRDQGTPNKEVLLLR